MSASGQQRSFRPILAEWQFWGGKLPFSLDEYLLTAPKPSMGYSGDRRGPESGEAGSCSCGGSGGCIRAAIDAGRDIPAPPPIRLRCSAHSEGVWS
jgi:hypothetical protein